MTTNRQRFAPSASPSSQRRLFHILTLLAALQLLPANIMRAADVGFAVLSSDKKTLTFKYGTKTAGAGESAYDLKQYDEPGWHYYNNNIETVIFDGSFSQARPTTCYHWFHNCENLRSIVGIENLNTSNVTSMYGMFTSCYKLISLDLRNFDTSRVTSMSHMFNSCSRLVTILVDPNKWNTQNVVNNNSSFRMFYECKNLRGGAGTTYNSSIIDKTYAIVDGGTDSPGYLTQQYAHHIAEYDEDSHTLTFKSTNDESIGVNQWDVSNTGSELPGWYEKREEITSVVFDWTFASACPKSCHSWFEGIKAIEVLPDFMYFNTSLTEDMSNMFKNSGFVKMNFNNFATNQVTNMNGMFSDCSKLVFLNSSIFNTKQTTDMSNMFYNCKRLTSLDLTSFATSNVTKMDNMFSACSNLSVIVVDASNWNTDNVTSSDNMFASCYCLGGVNNTEYTDEHKDKTYARIDGGPNSATPGYLTKTYKCYIAEYDAGTSTLVFKGSDSYANNTTSWSTDNTDNNVPWRDKGPSISFVRFERSFVMARPRYCKEWFYYNFKNLRNIDGLKYLNTSNVYSMQSMFYDCHRLPSLDLSNFDLQDVKNFNGMLSGCDNLTAIITPPLLWNLSIDDNYSGRVYDYYIAEYDGANTLTFRGSDTAPSVNQWDALNTGNTTPGWYAHREQIHYINIDKSFWHATPTSCHSWFEGMENLKDKMIDLSHLNTSCVNDMANMFKGCSSLLHLDLTSMDTRKVSDMTNMFNGCKRLLTITVIPGSWKTDLVTSSDNMFESCLLLGGDKGTIFDNNQMDKTYARIDGGNSYHGYLTKAYTYYYAEFNGTNTLTFKGGDTMPNTTSQWNTEENYSNSSTPWSSVDRSKVTQVIFDRSYANARPMRCDYWFDWFQNMTVLDGLEYLNTSNTLSMNNMFNYCSKLISLDLSTMDIRKVSSMNNLFCNCFNLTTIVVNPDLWKTNKVSSSSNMFAQCQKLVGGSGTPYNSSIVNVTYACVDGGVESPGYLTKAFTYYIAEYDGKNTLTFKGSDVPANNSLNQWDTSDTGNEPGWYTHRASISEVVFDKSFMAARPFSLHSWFMEMSNIHSSLDLTHLTTRSVTDMNSMFSGCSNLPIVDLSSFDTRNVTDMSNMFNDCCKLSAIIVNSFFWNTGRVGSSENMFNNCSVLEGDYGTVYQDGYPKDKTYARIDQGSSNRGYLVKVYPYYIAELSNSTTLTFRGSDTAPTNQNQWDSESTSTSSSAPWSASRDGITTVVFKGSYIKARPQSLFEWFYMFVNLERIDNLHYLNTSNAKTMYGMFLGCSKLTSLDLSNFETQNVTDFSMFLRNCKLSSLTIGKGFSTAKATKFYIMFDGFTNLTELIVKGNAAPNITNETIWDFTTSYETKPKLTVLDIAGNKSNILNEQVSLTDDNRFVVWKGGYFSSLNDMKLLSVNTSIDGWTYGEKPNSPTTPTGNDLEKVKTWEYSYKLKGSQGSYSDVIPTNAGIYTMRVIATPLDDKAEEYLPTYVMRDFEVQKKSIGSGTDVATDNITYTIKEGETDVTSSTYTYDGSQKTPTVVVTHTKWDSDETLVASEDGDYEVTYGPNKDVSDNVVVTITANEKNYTGSIVRTFAIAPKALTSGMVTISGDAELDYSGSEIKPALVVSDRPADEELITANDYTVGSGNTVPGTYTVEITGKGNYTGTIYSPEYKIVYPLSVAKKYTTFCSPFDLALKDGLAAYIVTDVDYAHATVTISQETGGIKAGTPMILIKTGEETDYKLEATPAFDLSSGTPHYMFKGGGVECSANKNIYVLQNTGNDAEFVWANSGTVPALKCYLDLDATASARNRSLTILFGDGTTSLSEKGIVNSEKFATADWYSLDGRKLNGVPKKKGLYLHNGQKVVIK